MEFIPITRDKYGLIENKPGLIKSEVNYVFLDNGLIDWRKMVRPEFLVPNRQNFAGRELPKTIEGLEDKDLLILLAGIKEVARLRGYTEVKYSVASPSSDYVVATCSITWIPNFETEDRVVTFSGVGDAGLVNTNGFGRLYLGPIAENRAFVRAVRNFLGINVLGNDELAPQQPANEDAAPNGPASPVALLEQLMDAKKVSFEEIKAKLVAEKVEGAEDLKSVHDIKKVAVFSLIERLKKKKV
jgi:hypothetical protein